MARSHWPAIAVTIAVLVSVVAPSVRGDVFNDIAIGLDYAGYNFLGRDNVDIGGRENLASGGVDFWTTVNFNGNAIDFGSWDLRMQGPVSFVVSTGGRLLSTIDISFQTALSADATATPLLYQLNLDSGNQLSTVEGSLLIDGDLSINQFGFYDIAFTYSSRQDISRQGRYADDEDSFDSDIGPIHIRGNIFADALAVLTTPMFEGAGRSNPFASFSGSAQLKEILEAESADALAQLAAGNGPFGNDVFAAFSLADTGEQAMAAWADMTQAAGKGKPTGAIPEPTVLLLLLLGIPAILVTRPRRRLSTS